LWWRGRCLVWVWDGYTRIKGMGSFVRRVPVTFDREIARFDHVRLFELARPWGCVR